LGVSSTSSGISSMALGTGATATNDDALAIGPTSLVLRDGGIAIGREAQAENHAIAIGITAMATNAFATAIGDASYTTADYQVKLGGDDQHVVLGMEMRGARLTNSTFRGTNVLNGRLDYTSRADSTLVNGANASIVLGTNVFVRLSGPTTVAGLSGFTSEQDGSFHIVQISGAITNVIVNEANSTDIATDGVPGNRIVTGTGANIYLTNHPSVFAVIYDATAARWKVLSWMR
jgi:hypothetical protein